MKRLSSLFAASLIVPVLGPLALQAAENTWNNGSGNFLWDAASSNWLSPGIWVDGSDAVFGAAGLGTVALGGPIAVHNQTFNAAGYTIDGAGQTLMLTGEHPTITFNGDTTLAADLAGTSGLTIQGTGVLTMAAGTFGNSYTGGTYLRSGTVVLAAPAAQSSGSAYALDSIEALDPGATVRLGSTFDGVSWSGPARDQIASTSTGFPSRLNMTGGTLDLYNDPKNQRVPMPDGTGLIINTGPDVQAGLQVIADGQDHLFSGVIADGNNGELIGDNSGQGPGYQIGIVNINGSINGGGGTLTLAGPNTYSGSTRVQTANLKLAGAGTLGRPTANGLTGPLRIYGPYYLDLNGTSQTIALMQNGNAAAQVFNSAVGTVSTLTFGYGNEQVQRNASYQFMDNQGTGGRLALRKIGATCTQQLSGANTYSGDTTVSEGTLIVGDGTASTAVSPGSAYRLSSSAKLVLSYQGTANVRQLWIDGVQKPNGEYGVGTPGIDASSTGTLTVTGFAEAPTLHISVTGADLSLTWSGNFRLQYQTNSMTGSWSDYPGGGTSPVNITVDKSQGAVYFRLSD